MPEGFHNKILYMYMHCAKKKDYYPKWIINILKTQTLTTKK